MLALAGDYIRDQDKAKTEQVAKLHKETIWFFIGQKNTQDYFDRTYLDYVRDTPQKHNITIAPELLKIHNKKIIACNKTMTARRKVFREYVFYQGNCFNVING